MPVKNCILEYVKRKTKATLQIFFYLTSEASIVCRLLWKVKNELKIYIISICEFGINISIPHVCIMMEELYFEFHKIYKLDFKRHFGKNSKSFQ